MRLDVSSIMSWPVCLGFHPSNEKLGHQRVHGTYPESSTVPMATDVIAETRRHTWSLSDAHTADVSSILECQTPYGGFIKSIIYLRWSVVLTNCSSMHQTKNEANWSGSIRLKTVVCGWQQWCRRSCALSDCRTMVLSGFGSWTIWTLQRCDVPECGR